MTGPGGKSVGRVSVRVVPDTSRFGKELRAQLEKIEQRVKATIGVELDDKGLKKKVQVTAKKASKGEAVKLKIDVDGDGVVRDTKKAKQAAQKGTGKISLTAGLNIKASLAKIWVDLKAIQAAAKAYRIRIPVDWVGLSKGLLIAGALSSVLLSIPHIVGAIGGAVNVVGGLLATIPALAAAATASVTVLIVGLNGMGKALSAAGDPEAFAEALKNLAPSAQEAAKALATFRKPLHDIRMSVQQRLFQGMADPLLSLKKLLPPIKAGLTGISGGIRDMGIEWIRMATTQKSVKDTGIVLGLTQSAVENARPALANFGRALKDIAVVGASFLPRMGLSVARISDRFADWAANARRTGQMRAWIENAWAKLKQLGRVLADIVAIFREFSEAMRGGRDFLDIIEGWTQSLRSMLESAKGQDTLKNLGIVMREVARVAGTVFRAAFESISDILSDAMPFLLEFARSLGGAIVGALKVITPLLQGLFRWLSENKEIMAPIAVAITGVVTAFKLFSTAAAGVKTVAKAFKGLWSAAKLVRDGFALIFKGVGLLWKAADWVAIWVRTMGVYYVKTAASAVANAAKAAAAWITQMAKAAAATATQVAKQAAAALASWARMAAGAALQAGVIVASWLSRMWLLVSTTAARLTTMAAIWLAHWLRMAAVATANALRVAAAWLIAMGPVALVIAVIVALVALIILNWDKIWSWTKSTFQAIWDFIVMIFTTVRDAIITAWNAVIDFFRNIPGWIGDALSTIWDVITWPFRKAWEWITGLWDDIGGFFSKIGGWISDAVSAVWEVLTWPFRKAWEIIQNIIGSIKSAIDSVTNWVGGLLSDQIGLSTGAVSVPVTFVAGELSEPRIPSLGFEPYAGEAFIDSTDGMDSMLGSLNRASKMLSRTSSDLGVDLDTGNSIGDQVAAALAGWQVVIDQNGIAKLVNKANRSNARRG